MSLERSRRVVVQIRELSKAVKNKKGKFITKVIRTRSFTVYGTTIDEIYDKIRSLFK